MSRKMVNVLKAKVKELKHNDLKAVASTPSSWGDINSGYLTYSDLERMHNIAINKQTIPNEFIKKLYSKKDENGKEDYRPFLKKVFIEMFKHAGATIPNDSIIEELITNYNQAGYTGFFRLHYGKMLHPFDLLASCSERISINMECNDPNYLRCFSGTKNISISYYTNSYYSIEKMCNLSSSVEFKLKCKDGNVTYEDGKVLLTIPKELKNYKVSGKNLFDVIVEYFQKFCEKLGFKFETKVEHSLGEPLKVINEPDVSPVEDLTFEVNNSR